VSSSPSLQIELAVRYRCSRCARSLAVEVRRSRCDCGGVLDLPVLVPPGRQSGQRFPLPLTWLSDQAVAACDLGVGVTPLLRWPGADEVWLKCDHLQPTGSFKDRGAHLLAALAWQLGAAEVVVDSSGNAAAALAAHAARAGLRCRVFVPGGTSPNKVRQITAYGAVLSEVPGAREAATAAAGDYATRTGALHASHALNPFFLEGTKAWVYEVLAERPDTETLVLPVGSGSLLLGVLRGLQELRAAGWLDRTPRLLLAQAAGYSPLAPDDRHSAAVDNGESAGAARPLAEGIAISRPARLDQMRSRFSDYDIRVSVVGRSEIIAARQELAGSGFYVEPTSAAAWAAWRQGSAPPGPAVVALTGHGLKAA
jgi:threonine synthase